MKRSDLREIKLFNNFFKERKFHIEEGLQTHSIISIILWGMEIKREIKVTLL